MSATTRCGVGAATVGRRQRRAGLSRAYLLGALAVSLVALAVSPGAALAAITVTRATIDGVRVRPLPAAACSGRRSPPT